MVRGGRRGLLGLSGNLRSHLNIRALYASRRHHDTKPWVEVSVFETSQPWGFPRAEWFLFTLWCCQTDYSSYRLCFIWLSRAQ